jgi:hypothetical protein
VKKFVLLFLKGITLGFGVGLCLAGAVGILYEALHSGNPQYHPGRASVYFLIVGALMGLLGGWCFALQMVLGDLLTSLFLKAADLVPMPAQAVGAEWAKKMESLFREIIKPFPGFVRKFIEWALILRFEDYGRINRALDKAKNKGQMEKTTTQWMLLVILHYLLEPLWIIFYAVYAILLLISCIFWSFPFFR